MTGEQEGNVKEKKTTIYIILNNVIARLKEELEKMRLLYGSQLSEVKLSIEKIYSSKVRKAF